jgi:putative ABC transport system permease protein
MLGLIGGVLGMAVGWAAVKALIRLSPVELPYWIDLRLDAQVVAFCAAATLVSVLLFGVAPAVKASGAAPAAALNELRRGVTAALRTGRLRQALVAAQVALSVVLLVGAGLMIRSFLKLQDFDLGFNPRGLLTFRVSAPRTRFDDPAKRYAFYRQMREQLKAIPGVRHVATMTGPPAGANWWRAVQVQGQTKTRPGDLPSLHHVMVSPGYFAAMAIPLKQGRDFTDADRPEVPVVIVNETFARKQWPDRDPIGQRVRIDPFLPQEPWRTIVGVVGDVRALGAREEAPPAIYVPEGYDARPTVSVAIRGDLPPAALVEPLRRVIRAVDTELPMFAARTAEALIAESTWQFRFFTFLLAVFAAVAVLLASVGLAGIMAHMVVERTHEIGVRMAIGASARDVVSMILSRAFLVVGVGAAAGVLSAMSITRALASQLFEVKPTDGVTFTAVLAVLLLAALIAAWLPARRAARVDPATALRFE